MNTNFVILRKKDKEVMNNIYIGSNDRWITERSGGGNPVWFTIDEEAKADYEVISIENYNRSQALLDYNCMNNANPK